MKPGPKNTPRLIAKSKGEATFETGKPCVRGHIGKRRVSSGECIQCVSDKHKTPTYRRVTESWRLRKLGFTIEEKDKLLKEQGGCCAICHQQFTKEDKLCNDHCHSTGKLRGIVHDHCNKIIGIAKESCELLRNAADYLERHQ